ncbi:MAG: hypothetical protein LAT68_10835 [Cyclobacteriaceae bacterium]|nr:hypothetical protein [Cyclobacteriaceae bacterium]MCH8516810.1 hypothetical protein [Cyclobacteriaceae bacterium]
MDLISFIAEYDHKGAVVLLEGKREVPEHDEESLRKLGRLLVERMKHARFRSGNASGSDLFFSEGVASVDAKRLEVITPYANHRKKQNLAGSTISLPDLNLKEEDEAVHQTRHSRATNFAVEQYLLGVKGKGSIRAAYLIRDTVKALGARDLPRTTVGLFYDDQEKPKSGGTGHTMVVCENNGIPYFDQRVWEKWIDSDF